MRHKADRVGTDVLAMLVAESWQYAVCQRCRLPYLNGASKWRWVGARKAGKMSVAVLTGIVTLLDIERKCDSSRE
jgi:hypothetical protein